MKKLFPLLLGVLLLVGCSTKFSYHFLDWAIEWEVEDYVTLNDEQEKAFEALVDKFVVWHQKEELARYAAQLESLATAINDHSLTPQMWARHIAQAKAHWFRLFEYALPDLLPLVASFSDAQVGEIIGVLRKNERELVGEYAGKTQLQLVADSDARLTEQFDDWLGSVSEAQQALIHQYNSQRLATLDMWLEYRHEWLRQFEQALAQRQDRALLSERLTLLMTRPDELKSEVYKVKLQQNTENFGAMLLAVSQTLSAKQAKHFNKKLNKLIKDLIELNQEAF
ncbi:DUF6279 family lipoprotein [Shewanella sp. AS16]|uniref:DUF6279 family lipoprotein n=1 Tax=Shewanella sp. AS16 TaxID=2907625 RepID=UPI001F3149AC|nr:DUF6279 family lipoprotein [Shewanella sp. AS16]MCE9684821.1 DUF6279 family lipoprotein [Shewanella sp. AS16]